MTSTKTVEAKQFAWGQWTLMEHSLAMPDAEDLDKAQELFAEQDLLSANHSGWRVGKRISNSCEDELCIPGAMLYQAYTLDGGNKKIESGLLEVFPGVWTEEIVALNASLRTLDKREEAGLADRELAYGQLPNGEVFLYGLNRFVSEAPLSDQEIGADVIVLGAARAQISTVAA